MLRRKTYILASALSLATFSINLQAQTSLARVGNSTFAISPIEPLVNLSEKQRYVDWAAAFIEPSMRLLGVLVDRSDRGLADLTIQRYVTVKTPRRFEGRDISEEQFSDLKRVLKQSTKNLDSLAESANARLPQMEDQLSAAIEAKMSEMHIGRPVLLEVQRDEPRGYGYTYIANYQAEIDGKSTTWMSASCGNTLLIKEKIIIINSFALYRRPDALEWLKKVCQEFSDELLRSN